MGGRGDGRERGCERGRDRGDMGRDSWVRVGLGQGMGGRWDG